MYYIKRIYAIDKMLKENLLEFTEILNNEYLDKYLDLCETGEHIKYNAHTRKNLGNYQLHHIIPRCFKIDHSENNVVKLSYSDHILAHYYLLNCLTEDCNYYHKLLYSFLLMTHTSYMLPAYNDLLKILPDLELLYKKAQESRHNKKLTDKHKEKISNSLKDFYNNETNEHKLNRIKNISTAKINSSYIISDETRKKLSEHSKWKGTEGVFKGRHHSEETKQKMKQQKQEYWKNTESRKKQSIIKKNLIKEHPEIIEKMRAKKIGKHWYNNGIISKQFREEDAPTGWVKGRLKNG